MKTCPYCAESIQDAAIVCRFCQRDLASGATPRQTPTTPPSSSPGVAAVLSLVIPGAGQLYKGQVGKGFLFFIGAIVGYLIFIVPGVIVHIVAILDAAASGSTAAVETDPDRIAETKAQREAHAQKSPEEARAESVRLLKAFGAILGILIVAIIAMAYLLPPQTLHERPDPNITISKQPTTTPTVRDPEGLRRVVVSAGEVCDSIVRSFHQGNYDGRDYWNVKCYGDDSRAYSVAIDADGKTKVLSCATLKAVARVDCFKTFAEQPGSTKRR